MAIKVEFPFTELPSLKVSPIITNAVINKTMDIRNIMVFPNDFLVSDFHSFFLHIKVH